MSAQVCAAMDCEQPLPAEAHGNQKYHAERCRNREQRRRHRARKKGREVVRKIKPVNQDFTSEDESADGRASARRGPGYERFLSEGYAILVANGQMSNGDAAKAMETSDANISRWLAAYHQDIKAARDREAWGGPDDEARQSLDDFKLFRDRYFERAPGKVYFTADFHLKWIDALLAAHEDGGRQMILSPPRHGKTELLIHFCIWLICRDPNVNIIWVAGSQDLAKNAVRMIEHTLETNDRLARDFTPAGEGFKPATRTGLSWSATEFTVSTRTTPAKSATMVGIGKGGTLLSRDADLIVADDIEDHGSVKIASTRQSTRDWWNTDLATRKMEHTGWVYIASRQDPDDLASHLLDNPEWGCIVEHAHDPACDLDNNKVEHDDCLLFPEMISRKYLIGQRNAIGRDRFEMVYQNAPEAGSGAVFSREHIDRCKNTNRTIRSAPSGIPLVAGLDPATRGHQAAVLLAYDPETSKRYLVDVDDTQAGGLEGARRIIKQWHGRYQVTRWIIERNNYQDAIFHDRDIQQMKADLGLILQPHFTTGQNKWDDNLGVTLLARQFEQGLVDLPYGDLDSKLKVDAYVRQMLTFDGRQRGRSDQVMAGWFAELGIQRWYANKVEGDNVVQVNFDRRYPKPTSFSPSRYVTAPWR